MDFPEKLKKFFTRKVKIRIAYITLIIVVLLGGLFNFTVYYDKLYYGLSVNGVYVGGSTVDEAKEIFENTKLAKDFMKIET